MTWKCFGNSEILCKYKVAVVQSLCHGRLFETSWTATSQASLSFTISWSLLKLMSIELMMLSNHLILCQPFLLPSILPSIKVFANESALRIRWPKYLGFSFSVPFSNEYLRLISFRIDFFDFLGYMSIPISQFILSPPSPMVTLSLISISVYLFLFVNKSICTSF